VCIYIYIYTYMCVFISIYLSIYIYVGSKSTQMVLGGLNVVKNNFKSAKVFSTFSLFLLA